jgi:ParB family chromosome partitioning protein
LLQHAERWKAQVPEGDALWPWLERLDEGTRQALMAYCVGLSLNALVIPHRQDNRAEESRAVAKLVSLDMRQWWEPSLIFFGHLTKAQILSAIGEGASPEAARQLSDLKKIDLVGRAVELLAGRGWLPEVFRLSDS